MRNSQQRGDEGVAARLRQHAVAGVDQDDGQVGGGGAGGHVARVLLVPGRIGDDELAPGRGEVAVGDVDGDALLALGAEAVGEEREIQAAGGEVAGGFADGGELVFVDALGIVEQAADEGGLAVVDAAGRGEAQELGLGSGLEPLGRLQFRERRHLEIALPLLDFHGAFLVVVDDAVFALGAAELDHLLDDLGDRVGLGADGAGAGSAAERAHAAHDHLRLLAGQQRDVVLDRDQRLAADHHRARLGEVQRHDRDVLQVDVMPDVQLRPVGKREDADALALVDAAVVEVPQFRALILGIPLAEAVAEGVDPLLGAGFLFVAAGAAEGRIETAFGQGVEQRAGLEQAAAFLGAEAEGTGAVVDRLAVRVDDQSGADLARRNGRETRSFRGTYRWYRCAAGETECGAGMERLLRQPDHHGGVFADGVQHHRRWNSAATSRMNVNAFGFQQLEGG